MDFSSNRLGRWNYPSDLIRHLGQTFEQLANALLLRAKGQRGGELLLGTIHTSDDPGASPQGHNDQRNNEHTGHDASLAPAAGSFQHTRTFRWKMSTVAVEG
jgi:hypothetical protein